MLRTTFIVFLLGWSTWFMIDKSPGSIGHLPEPGGDLLDNFQTAFNILKAGYPKPAWVFIWPAHYLLLSLLGGLLVSIGWQGVSSALARKRLRKMYIPQHRDSDTGSRKDETGRPD